MREGNGVIDMSFCCNTAGRRHAECSCGIGLPAVTLKGYSNQVEKRVPHYDLIRIQRLVAEMGVSAFTKTALDGGRAMGLTTGEMLQVIASLVRRNFYKAMTTHVDHRIWQDVYHADTPVQRQAYIKITFREHAPVIQFKEK